MRESISASSRLFDHLVYAHQELLRDLQAEGSRRREIEDQFESCRLLDWHIARLRALQDAMNVIASAPKQVDIAWPVGHQASGSHEITGTVDHRQSRAERESENAVEISDDKLVYNDIERIRLQVELLEHGSYVLRAPYFEESNVELEFACRGFGIAHLQYRLIIAAIVDDGQVAAVMGNVAGSLLADPLRTAELGLLAFAIFFALMGVTVLVFRAAGAERALALGLMVSQRNMGLMLAATEGVLPGTTWLYFALSQFPIYLSPQLLRPVVGRLRIPQPMCPASEAADA